MIYSVREVAVDTGKILGYTFSALRKGLDWMIFESTLQIFDRVIPLIELAFADPADAVSTLLVGQIRWWPPLLPASSLSYLSSASPLALSPIANSRMPPNQNPCGSRGPARSGSTTFGPAVKHYIMNWIPRTGCAMPPTSTSGRT